MLVNDSGQGILNYEEVPQQFLTPDELYNGLNEANLRRWKEDSRFEKKSARIQAVALGDYFSMWANTAPEGGLVIVGISKDLVFEGCLCLDYNKLNEIEKTGEIYCADAVYSVKRIRIHRDKDGVEDFVLAFRVSYHKSRVVRTSSNHVFIRRADSKFELKTDDEIRQLKADKGEVSFESEPCGLSYPSDFQMQAVEAFTAEVVAKKTWSEAHTVEDVLELMHLGTKNGNTFVPNVACALLFARDPRRVTPGCRIRFLRFESEEEGTGDKWNATKDEFIDGTIPQQIERADALLKSQLRAFSRLGTGGKFFTSLEYPEFAWHEAIVNGCCHRAYGNGMKNTPVFVKMFDDRLEIESPGPFPQFVTPDNIYEMHVPRNPYLMDALYYLKHVKCAHEGTRRMRTEMKNMELPTPEFAQDEVGHALVRVTLRNSINQRKVWVDSDVVELLGTQIARTLNELEKRCINFCAEHGQISVSEAQRLTGIATWHTARNLLDRLVMRGILVRRKRTDIVKDSKARYMLIGSLPEDDKPRKANGI